MSHRLDHRSPPVSGEVITFYSYKGGTGRSMMLANVAWQLASAGKKVLLIDWDLEAPGLHRYFRPFLGDDPELREQDGVMEWVTDYWDACLDEPDKPVDELVLDHADPRHYVRRLRTEAYISDGGIDLMCAGRQDKHYAESVADFDWTRLYAKLRGEEFIEAAKRILVGPGGYDYVLIDSRTGVSDTSGFCTVALADTLVVCFTYNNQSVIGASQIARDIRRQAEARRQSRVERGEARRFRLFAVPSRVDDLDPERLERRQRHAWSMFSDLLTDIAPDQQAAYWLSVQIRNQGLFAYEEVLAACMNRPTDPQSVLGAITHLTRHLTDDTFTDPPALDDDQRRELRDKFAALDAAQVSSQARGAWTSFVNRIPDEGAREVVLQSCFPLLSQLYTVSTAVDAGTTGLSLVRTLVLEAELTVEERRMAEMLTAVNVTQRRITDDRQRAVIVSDDSIAAHWTSLGDRLQLIGTFIAQREQIRQGRRAWESGGRSITALKAVQAHHSDQDFNDEQRSWLGRPNLLFLQALQELRTLESNERAAQDRLARIEEENKLRLDDLQRRQIELETVRAEREALLLQHADEQRIVSTQAERRSAKLRLSVMACGMLVAATGFAGWRYQTARAAVDQANAQIAKLTSANKEYEIRSAADASLRAYGEATTLMVRAGKNVPSNRDYDKRINEAIEAYSTAITNNPEFAEAYRGRAYARGNLNQKDVSAELVDWAIYYNLRPSLNGRSQLILRALGELSVNETVVLQQLTALATDARTPGPRDASPRKVAATLEAAYAKTRPTLQPMLRETIDKLIEAETSGIAK